MYYADTAFMGCYNLRCSLGKGSSNKAFRHWGGAMTKLFWPRFLASLGNENRLKNIDFILTGQFASALAYLQTSTVAFLRVILERPTEGSTSRISGVLCSAMNREILGSRVCAPENDVFEFIANDNIKIDIVYSSEECYDEVD